MDYKYLYHLMFNAATDAMRFLDDNRADFARLQLILAQQKTEDEYIKNKGDEDT